MLRSSEMASMILAASPGRDRRALADVRADGQESGVEFAFLSWSSSMLSTLLLSFHLDAEFDDALHFCFQNVARQAILGNAEAHHAAEQRTRFVERDTGGRVGAGGRQPTCRRGQPRRSARACPIRWRAPSASSPA
jgi:hypothetical protein